jgi:hypothetical protein
MTPLMCYTEENTREATSCHSMPYQNPNKECHCNFYSHPMPMAHADDVGLFQQEIAVEEEAGTPISINPLSQMHVSSKVLHCNQFDLFIYICTV